MLSKSETKEDKSFTKLFILIEISGHETNHVLR